MLPDLSNTSTTSAGFLVLRQVASSTSSPVTAPDGTSSFARSVPYGLSLELPPAAQPPDGTVIRTC